MSIDWKVPLADVDLDGRERDALVGVLESKWLSMGPVTQEFESAFAELVPGTSAVAVSSGTAALHIALLLADIGPGMEVLTPALTFVAVANAIVHTGARPVFVDVKSLDDWTIDPIQAAQRITPRSRAIVPMHYAGYLCDMSTLLRVAQARGLVVIEDAAHAVGASAAGTAAGAFGDAGCFSFFPNKNLTSGEGGMLVTKRAEWADRARRLRSHGMTTVTWQRHAGHASSYDVLEPAFNYRTSDVEASIGLVQLQKLAANNARRRALVDRYRRQLPCDGLSIPFGATSGQSPAYHLFPILLDASVDRARFMSVLREHRIQTSVHYPPIHQFTWYRQNVPCSPLPVTEAIGERMVTLPLFATMKSEAVDYVVETVHDTLRAS